jgi:hypothetical protein
MCSESLPESRFKKCVYSKDSIRSTCRICTNIIRRARYRSDSEYRDRMRRHAAKYQRSDAGREASRRAVEKRKLNPRYKFMKDRWNHSRRGRDIRARGLKMAYHSSPESREKQIVRAIFNDAIKSGVVKKGRCQVCGDSRAVGHHTEYRRSTACDVIWMCREHHGGFHSWLRMLRIPIPVFLGS